MKTNTLGLSALVFMSLSACSDGTGPGTGAGNESVSLSFATNRSAGSGALPAPGFSAAAMGDTLVSGNDVLIINRVQMVLREIELKRASAPGCFEEDDCEKFEVGPLLVDLPLNGETSQVVQVKIDPDTYNEIEFELHKPSQGDPSDDAFIAANPNFAENSVRVEGTFNGQVFVYTSDVDVEQEFDLVPPLVVDTAEVSSNLTLRVDISQWFVSATGALIDPATANKGEVNEGVVVENIKQSIEAFEDADRDGDDADEDN